MMRTHQWLSLINQLKAMGAPNRKIRICMKFWFPTARDLDTLPILFPYVETLGLVILDQSDAEIIKAMCNRCGWDKVVPVLDGNQFRDDVDLFLDKC